MFNRLAEYILASIRPKEKDFIHDTITSVLDNHDDNHPVEKNAGALSIKDFTIFFVLSVLFVTYSDCS